MKTRIVHTKLWEDDEYLGYSKHAKLLFIYCITNYRIGFTGMYELSEKSIQFSTGLKPNEIESAKKELEQSIAFYKGFVFVFNAGKYSGFNSPKHINPRKREVEQLPDGVRELFMAIDRKDIAYSYPMDRVWGSKPPSEPPNDLEGNESSKDVSKNTLPIGYVYGSDTPINNKDINNKYINNIEGGMGETKAEPMLETVEDSAKKILEKWNNVFGTRYSSIVSITDNLKYWLPIHPIQEILEGIDKAKQHHYWANSITPEIYLRQKNPNGERVDRIEEMKNYIPKKSFANEKNEKYEKFNS